MADKRFAEVVTGLPIDKVFHYSIPQDLEGSVKVGMRVEIPFGARRIIGYVVGFKDRTNIENVKPIYRLIDKEPLLDEESLKLSKWICDYYLCSWGEAIEAVLPMSIKKIDDKTMYDSYIFGTDEAIIHEHLKPSLQQRRALDAIIPSIGKDKPHIFLLHGITASGKTEVYLQTIDHALSKGYSSIVLVPEIALTAQTIERLKERFGDLVAVWHSRLLRAERLREWTRIKSGQAKVVVGARSAIFSPVTNLGLVVIDEEHEITYKQQTSPRYHARDVAIERIKLSKAVLILSSATPSIESYYNALYQKFSLIELTERIEKKELPAVEIIDMRRFYSKKRLTIFSNLLERSIEDVLHKGEQAILFLNRRGFSTYAKCSKCGKVLKCNSCSTALIYHFDIKKLVCHRCNFKMDPPDICPKCKEFYIKFGGVGTEKVESELHRLFPSSKIGRLDTDVTRKRLIHNTILNDFKMRKLDILVGTQMIAKGLDFPHVTLVGVISADTALNLVDFRSGERTFNLLTQVAGRSGRGSQEGKVIIQTYTPTHYAILAARTHDYQKFYKKEILQRRQMKLPPFANIILFTFYSKDNEKAKSRAKDFVDALKNSKKRPKMEIIGPVIAPIPQLRKNFRWNVLVKTKDVLKTNSFIKGALEAFRSKASAKLTIDVDPIQMQ